MLSFFNTTIPVSNSVLNLTFSTVEPYSYWPPGSIDVCKLICEICEDQQFNNSFCQKIPQECNNCMEGQKSNPISLHQKDDIPSACYEYQCKYCEEFGSNDTLCQIWLSKCNGCLFFYGVPPNPGRK